jgi:hypothetical protein
MKRPYEIIAYDPENGDSRPEYVANFEFEDEARRELGWAADDYIEGTELAIVHVPSRKTIAKTRVQ